MSYQDRHLAGRCDREDIGIGEVERPRFGAIRPQREQIDRIAVPRRAVDDGVTVGRESRIPDRAAPECELAIRRR